MGDHDALGPGLLGVLARLLGREMTAHPGALRARQRRLDDQQVGVAGDLDDLLAGPGVGAVGDVAAVLRADPDGERLDEVREPGGSSP